MRRYNPENSGDYRAGFVAGAYAARRTGYEDVIAYLELTRRPNAAAEIRREMERAGVISNG